MLKLSRIERGVVGISSRHLSTEVMTFGWHMVAGENLSPGAGSRQIPLTTQLGYDEPATRQERLLSQNC